MESQVRAQVGRFYDGGVPGVPPDRSALPQVVLVRCTDTGIEEFGLARRIAYDDRHLGELLVPDDPARFRSDLTSVPAVFTWLVPRTGAHLPAALVHDGLVGAPEYVSTAGHVVDRVTADRVFRDAMADTGTGVVRRWLVWSAVTAATIADRSPGSTGWSAGERRRRVAAALLSLGVVLVLGVLATLDLLDVLDVLPWMGGRSWWLELAGGLAGAVVVPLALALTWGSLWRAGAVLGIGLAALLPVTLVLAALTAAYQLAERLAHRAPSLALALGALLVAASLVLTLALVVTG